MRGMFFQTDQWKTARPSVFNALTFFFNLKIRAPLVLACLLPVLCSAEKSEPRLASVVTAAANHDHPVDATYRLLESGIRTFNLTEKEGHTHTITLTSEQAGLVLLGMPVTVESTMSASHTHSVTVRKQD
jgi:hypothetical protein